MHSFQNNASSGIGSANGWIFEAFFLLRRHKNCWLDISGIPPKTLLESFPRLDEIADRVLFGTDWPSPGVKSLRQNLDDVLALPLSADAKQRIVRHNALRLFPPGGRP